MASGGYCGSGERLVMIIMSQLLYKYIYIYIHVFRNVAVSAIGKRGGACHGLLLAWR